MNLLKKALETNSEQILSRVINKMTGFPSTKEIALKLAHDIYETRYDYFYSFEFEFIKGEYSFYCDVNTCEHGTGFETSCPIMFRNGEEITVPASFFYEIDFEVKMIN